MICPACGDRIADGIKYCPRCGMPIKEAFERITGTADPAPGRAAPSVPTEAPPQPKPRKFCGKCGNPILPEARFCNQCGAVINRPKAPARPPSGGAVEMPASGAPFQAFMIAGDMPDEAPTKWPEKRVTGAQASEPAPDTEMETASEAQ